MAKLRINTIYDGGQEGSIANMVESLKQSIESMQQQSFMRGVSGESVKSKVITFEEILKVASVFDAQGKPVTSINGKIDRIFSIDGVQHNEWRITNTNSLIGLNKDWWYNAVKAMTFTVFYTGENTITNTPFLVFIDPRLEQIKEYVHSGNCQFNDKSCVIAIRGNITDGDDVKIEMSAIFPRLYYNDGARAFCWEINGEKTSISAQGIAGKDGASAEIREVSAIYKYKNPTSGAISKRVYNIETSANNDNIIVLSYRYDDKEYSCFDSNRTPYMDNMTDGTMCIVKILGLTTPSPVNVGGYNNGTLYNESGNVINNIDTADITFGVAKKNESDKTIEIVTNNIRFRNFIKGIAGKAVFDNIEPVNYGSGLIEDTNNANTISFKTGVDDSYNNIISSLSYDNTSSLSFVYGKRVQKQYNKANKKDYYDAITTGYDKMQPLDIVNYEVNIYGSGTTAHDAKLLVDGLISLPSAISSTTKNGVKIGNSEIFQYGSDELIIKSNTIRFGSSNWDWDGWAGLKYNYNTNSTSPQTIYLGFSSKTDSTFNRNVGLTKQGVVKLVNCGLDASDATITAKTFKGYLDGNAASATRIKSQGREDALTGTTKPSINGVSMYECYGNKNYPVTFGNVINICGEQAKGAGQLLCEWSGTGNDCGHLYYKSIRDNQNNWSVWKTIAFTTDNVASANKLATPRKIWGQSFDGTADITGDLTTSGSITASKNIYANGGMTIGATQWLTISPKAFVRYNYDDDFHCDVIPMKAEVYLKSASGDTGEFEVTYYNRYNASDKGVTITFKTNAGGYSTTSGEDYYYNLLRFRIFGTSGNGNEIRISPGLFSTNDLNGSEKGVPFVLLNHQITGIKVIQLPTVKDANAKFIRMYQSVFDGLLGVHMQVHNNDNNPINETFFGGLKFTVYFLAYFAA